ncbi:hypothetical protein AgCh_012663 [Apium graveolens]
MISEKKAYVYLQIDKASVLGEAANYIKQLQGRVKTLEEKVIEKDGEAIVAVDRSRPRFDEESSSSGEDNFADYNNQSIPEIEVRISETEVFLRIHSKQIPGMAVKMLSEIEKLHMIIISSSVMPFANDSLLVTVIAQAHGVWEAIEPKDAKAALEDKIDKRALAVIYQGVPEDVLLSIAEKKTSKDA